MESSVNAIENHSQQNGSLAKFALAFAKAQAEFPIIPKDSRVEVKNKEGRFLYEYWYADLTTIISHCRPALTKHGISFTQMIVKNEIGLGIETLFLHESGECLRAGFVPCAFPAGADGKAMAGIVTYMKRISLTAALGVSADEDVDAAAQEASQGNTTDKGPKKKEAPKNHAPQMNAAAQALKDAPEPDFDKIFADPTPFVIGFGPYKGRQIDQIPPERLKQYVEHIEEQAKAQGLERPTGPAGELVFFAREHLNSLGGH